MTRSDLIIWIEAHGWKQDRWGHWRKGDYRMRISSHAARLEVQTEPLPGVARRWVRLKSGYLLDISVTDNDKLAGMTNYGCAGAIPKRGGG